MKAMLWKELRENLKWAVLALVGLGLAEFYGLYHIDSNSMDQGVTSLCKSTFLMATTFGCALIGLVLGFLQILPEQRRDQWAALVHRPVSRGLIFRGKAVAGIILYLLATVPPFLICTWLVATPGHFVAPFVGGTVLAGTVDICAGLVYYFAALLLTLQRGSWFGARMLALFAAVHLSFYIPTTEDSFFHVMVATVLMGLVLFTAAWGAMLSNGPFRMRPWLGKLALVVAVFYGFCGIGDLGRILFNANVTDTFGSGPSPEYKITKEGVPLIVTRNADLSETVTDLDGHVIDDERYKGNQAYENFMELSQVAHLVGDLHGLYFPKRFPEYRSSWMYIFPIRMNDNRPHPVEWFWLQGAKYFVGISNVNKMPVKILDQTGFHAWGAVPVPFQYGDNIFSSIAGPISLVNEGKTVHVVDFPHERMFDLPNPDGATVFTASPAYIRTAAPGINETAIVLVTGKELRVYDAKGNPIVTLPYHHDVDRLGMIDFSMTPAHDRFYVHYSASRWIDWAERHLMTSYLEELDAAGNVVHSYVLPALPVIPPDRTWAVYLAESSKTPAFWYGTVAYQWAGAALGFPHYDDRGYNPFYPEWSHPWWVGQRLLLVSLLFAPVALGLARWGGFSWRVAVAWAVLTFAFNLAGLLTLCLVADWPVWVRCPLCGRKRPVEENGCPHCHGSWPSRPSSGIEIFDRNDSEPADTAHEATSLSN
jgi:hypothetical protein